MKEKWTTLQHNGVLFPKEYKYIGFDKNISSLAEEMLYHYSAKLETDYVKDFTFNSNFWKALKQQLPKDYQSKKFPEDFLPLIKIIFSHIQKKKEALKQISKETKTCEKKEKEEIKSKYGYAILNGEKQPLGMYIVESAGIFLPRGKHPSTGCWKFRPEPKDIIINHSLHLNPPKGDWKVVENKKSMELATYDIKLSNGKVLHKRILFGATSIVKQDSDKKKFDKAIILLNHWNKVEQHIEKNLSHKDEKRKQSAIVSYLIMNLGIRVGDEKDDDLADTVGASTLKKCNIQLLDDNNIHLSFLGKDSVTFEKTITVSTKAYKTLQELYIKRQDKDMLFPKVCSIDVNKFLSEVVEGISAKVFRTAYGSLLLAENLRKETCEGMTLAEKISVFNKANLVVAKQLNHQKNMDKNQKEKEIDISKKIKELKANYKEVLEKNTDKIQKLKKQLKAVDTTTLTKETKKQMKELMTNKIVKLEVQIEKAKNRIVESQLKLELKKETKDVALGTSKTSYSSPRIVVSWCKDVKVPIEKIYSKTLLSKFEWALDTEKDYYKKYPQV